MRLPSTKLDLAWPILAVFAIYANALWWGVFQFDDYNVIVGDAAVHSWDAWWNGIGHGIRPLLKLTYTADWTSGWGPAGFHFTNMAIHAANCLLVWQLTRRFAAWHELLRPHARKVALATALLYAVHPVHTEVVSYISGRSSSLMTLCYFGAVLVYLIWSEREDSIRRHLVLYGAIPFLFAAAVMVKESAVTLPIALLLVEYLRGTPWRESLRRQWPSWFVLGIMLAGIVSSGHYGNHVLHSLALNTGFANMATQAQGVTYLLGQWFWPLHLNIDPDLPRFVRVGQAWPWLATMIVALLWLAYWFHVPARASSRPLLEFALAWVIVHLVLLYLLLPRLDVANERQLYWVSWPLLMALVAEMATMLTPARFLAVVAMLTLSACWLTVERNRDYFSEIALWEATVEFSPSKSRVHNNLGYAYWQAGRHADARSQYQCALQLDVDNYRARFNLRGMDLEPISVVSGNADK